MKTILLTFGLLAISLLDTSQAVSINLGQTAGAARFLVPTAAGVGVSAAHTISIGTMTNAADAGTFIVFGSGAMHGNTVFLTGVGTLAIGVASGGAALAAAASTPVYIRVEGPSGGGIWRTTNFNYPADFSAASANPANPSLSSNTWQSVNPATGWAYLPSGYTENSGALGLSDASAGGPTERTGDAFVLGAPIPEPSVVALLGLLGLVGLRRRR